MFQVQSVEELEKLSYKVKWQYFEKLVAFIFEQNDFDVQHNKVISRRTKRQFDVIAKKDKTFLIECKRIKIANDALLKGIVKKHKERCGFYKRGINEDIIPLIVTPKDGVLTKHQNVFIVPITSLNWFLNDNYSNYPK